MKQNIRTRIFIAIFLTVTIIYSIATVLIIYNVRKMFTRNLTTQTVNTMINISKYYSSLFSTDVEVLRVLKNTEMSLPRDDYNEMIKMQNVIIRNSMGDLPQLLSIGVSWEINAINPNYNKDYGRYRYLFYRNKGNIVEKIDTLNVNDPGIGSMYYNFKITKRDDVTDIYYDSYTGKKEDQMLMTSIVLPFDENDIFKGLIAADISLDRFKDIIFKTKPSTDANIILFSHTGTIVASTNNSPINQLITSVLGNKKELKQILFHLDDNTNFSYVRKDSLGNKDFIFIQPFSFGQIKRNWGIAAIIPLKTIKKDASRLTNIAVLVAAIGLIFIIIISLLLINSIINPLEKVVESLERISNFDISKSYILKVSNLSELGRIEKSINNLINSLIEIRKFTQQIAEGNLETAYTPKGPKDIIGASLLQMRRNLKIAQIESKKREEEEHIQRWSIEGEAKVGEILRDYSQNPEQLYYEIISFLVKYTKSVQGALFVVNKEEKKINLVAAYAYDRKKFFDKEIPFGVGLIGRSVIERETLYITNVPEAYSSVSSGLGQKKPRAVLIVPLKFNEQIYSIVELNTFTEYKPYVRAFVGKVGVNIASTIANTQITIQTKNIVSELKNQSQQMKIQEEQMRKTIEDLRESQGSLQKRINESDTIINAFNQISYITEYNMNRELININNKFLMFLNKKRDEMLGIKQGGFSDEEQTEQYDELWEDLENGKIRILTQKINLEQRIIWFSEAYIPVFDELGKPFKVICISNDVTNLMEKNK